MLHERCVSLLGIDVNRFGLLGGTKVKTAASPEKQSFSKEKETLVSVKSFTCLLIRTPKLFQLTCEFFS